MFNIQSKENFISKNKKVTIVQTSLLCEAYTVDDLIVVGTNFRGLNRNGIFVGFKICGHYIFPHKAHGKSLFRGYCYSWIGSVHPRN